MVTKPDHALDSINEAAARLGISRSLLYSEINRGRLRSVKVGKRRLIPRDAQVEWLANLAKNSPSPRDANLAASALAPMATIKESIPNPFRPAYRKLPPDEQALHDAIKDKAYDLHCLFSLIPQGRLASIAKTDLESSVMWAIKALTA